VVGIVAAVVALFAFLVTLGGKSQRYEECEAAMQAEGYRGAALEQAIQFCVDVE